MGTQQSTFPQFTAPADGLPDGIVTLVTWELTGPTPHLTQRLITGRFNPSDTGDKMSGRRDLRARKANALSNQMITNAWVFSATLWTVALVAIYVFEL